MTTITIGVTVTENGNGQYSWTYQSNGVPINMYTGEIILPSGLGETKIQYVGLNPEISLIYANLNPSVCATRQIVDMQVDRSANTITLTDANSDGMTGNTPFGILLVARQKGNLNAPIVSPDPEVVNNPGPPSYLG